MKKMFCRIGCMLFSVFLFVPALTGCIRRTPEGSSTPQLRIVTAINITGYRDGQPQLQRHYTSSEKMRAVLDYLRLLRTYGSPSETPEASTGDCFEIVLTRSDGTQKQYWQLNDQYLKEESHEWEYIKPEDASQFLLLLQRMESDVTADAVFSEKSKIKRKMY